MRRRRLLAVPLLLALAACGGADGEEGVARNVRSDDLAVMVLPRSDLGALGTGLRVAEDSGPTDNGEAAEATVDPKDTARDLAGVGRLDGYRLSYAAAGPADSRSGVITVVTEVELFRTEEKAATYLRKQMQDLERLRGRTLEGVRFAQVERFEVGDVGEEAEGMGAVLATRKEAGFMTGIAFRRDRIIGSAIVLLSSEREVSADIEEIARALDERVRGVMADKIRTTPVRLPGPRAARGPDPKPLTLTASELGLRGVLNHGDYFEAKGVRAYRREYDVTGGTLGRSQILYLRTTAQVFENARAAAREQDYLASRRGSTRVARRMVEGWFRGTGFRPRTLETRRLTLAARDTAGFHFFIDAPKGRLEAVVISVGRARVRGTVTVLGFDRELHPADVFAVRPRLLAGIAR